MCLNKIDGRIGEKSYDRKSAKWEKGRVLNFLLWNSIWKDRCLHPNYRQPFRVLRKTSNGMMATFLLTRKRRALINSEFPLTTIVSLFSPRRRLYEPKATIPSFLTRETRLCFAGAGGETWTRASKNVFIINMS